LAKALPVASYAVDVQSTGRSKPTEWIPNYSCPCQYLSSKSGIGLRVLAIMVWRLSLRKGGLTILQNELFTLDLRSCERVCSAVITGAWPEVSEIATEELGRTAAGANIDTWRPALPKGLSNVIGMGLKQ
jgi:hypothetical protein